MADSWVLPVAGGSVLRVRVRPGAARPGIAGLHGGALALRVGARPVQGAANRAVLGLVAAILGVAPSTVELIGGARGREKRVRVQGLDPETIQARLGPLLRI